MKIGYKKYRERDAFNRPDFHMSKNKLAILELGCLQILEYKGMTPETAFEGLEISGFYRLMELFHYELYQQSLLLTDKEYFLDRMFMKHKMTGTTLILYNKVKKFLPDEGIH